MKKFCIWHGDGKKEIIEGNSATVSKKPEGLKIKIGKTQIVGAVGLTEVCENIKIQ